MRSFKILAISMSILLLVSLIGAKSSSVSPQNKSDTVGQTESTTDIQNRRFKVAAPIGGAKVVGQLSKQTLDPHAFPTYDVRLILPDGRDAGWALKDVVYASWSADGISVALEDTSHQVYVASVYAGPVLIGIGYTTPGLSPLGNLLVAQKLGDGEHILHQIEHSPGLVMKNLRTNEEYIVVASNDVYLPFFVDEGRIGFGSGGGNHIASLYLKDLRTGATERLTNIKKSQTMLDPFPTSVPLYDEFAGVLRFPAQDKRGRAVFELSLSTKVLLRQIEPDQNEGPSVVSVEPDSTLLAVEPVGREKVTDPVNAAATKTLFRMPMAAYGGIYNYYDHGGRDWGCGQITYSGHQGTDFKLPVGTSVKAAAGGNLYYRYDNCPDTGSLTSTCGGGYGNHVRIEHPKDLRVSIYGHMKAGTLRSLGTVSCGTEVGKSASSGRSSAPHLHFEVWKTRTGTIRQDPYLGPCNSIGSSDWVGQGSYPSAAVVTTCQP